ncbi:MAG TPA: mechanosensitive ion channel [Burkholderiaceae bacterium]|nr:mechanosensitive ion channel [Burkholderiaceae bacterium]
MVTHKVLPADDLKEWVSLMFTPSVLIELVVLLVCFGLAWGVTVFIRGNVSGAASRATEKSIFFGNRVFDGVLFPLLWLCFTYAAQIALHLALKIHLLYVAVPTLLSLFVIRMGVKILQVAFTESPAVRFIERTISWLVWLAFVLWVSGVLPLVATELEQIRWKVSGHTMSLSTMLEGVLTAGVVLLLSLWMSSAVEAKLLRHASGGELSLRKAASNAVRALLVFIGLLLSLSMVGIDLTALSVLGGAVGVGIGLGLQKLASNYVSGFVILTERSMRIGDFVRLDNFEGRITDIKTRYTVIRSAGGRESIVPNELLVTSRVENLTFSDSMIAQQALVTVGYDSDAERVSQLLVQAALAQNRVLPEPAPVASLTAFGANGLDFTLTYWITDPENGQLNIRSDVNKGILAALRAHHIDIPYPQQVVHEARSSQNIASQKLSAGNSAGT